MVEEVQPVFQLRMKMHALQAWARNAGRNQICSMSGIAGAMGVAKTTLQSNIDNEKMSIVNQEKLARLFGFETAWKEWRDVKAFRGAGDKDRLDNSMAFEQRFLKYKSQSIPLTILSDLTREHLDRRFADFSFSVPGSFIPTEATSGIPLVLSLSFDRRGWPVQLGDSGETFVVGLKEVDLELTHNRDGARINTESFTCRSDGEGNFTAQTEGIGPWWIISLTDGDAQWLCGRRLPNDGADCVCKGFRLGDYITARMKARVDNCVVSIAN